MKWDSRRRLGTRDGEISDTAEQMGEDILSTVYMPRILVLHLFSGAARVKKVGGKMTLQPNDITYGKSPSRPASARCVHSA